MRQRDKAARQAAPPIPSSPDEAPLDRVPNPHPDTNYVARFTAPEFTTLCPVTGQPDFAHPGDRLRARPLAGRIEVAEALSRELPQPRRFPRGLHGRIGKRLTTTLKPRWLRIGGYWYPRGGMPIDVFWQAGELPDGVWVPDQGVAPYRGRG